MEVSDQKAFRSCAANMETGHRGIKQYRFSQCLGYKYIDAL